ncbi:unnamed protein product [Zymoseptoria tritici ST99CH_1E4]|uniref:Uncharacterized protein n=1 Tax=Zymoseptoria tritici ST99CH_1E4 TaxID=1276532 RepID=A0A2H1GQD3_ZYMTR|nr:unnamed protein product [Zymoseptoria tritici ST99CH_1E4]
MGTKDGNRQCQSGYSRQPYVESDPEDEATEQPPAAAEPTDTEEATTFQSLPMAAPAHTPSSPTPSTPNKNAAPNRTAPVPSPSTPSGVSPDRYVPFSIPHRHQDFRSEPTTPLPTIVLSNLLKDSPSENSSNRFSFVTGSASDGAPARNMFGSELDLTCELASQ